MTHISFLAKAINDLIKLNESRIANYTQASQKMENSDPTLKEVCLCFILEGKQNIKELHVHLFKITSQIKFDKPVDTKFFKLWIEAVETNAHVNVEPSFAACVCSEDAVQKLYDETLLIYSFMPTELKTIIIRQKKKIAKTKKIIMNHLHVNNRAIA